MYRKTLISVSIRVSSRQVTSVRWFWVEGPRVDSRRIGRSRVRATSGTVAILVSASGDG